MDFTDLQLDENIQGYRLPSGETAWCLAIRHPSRFFCWRETHELIMAFLDQPERAAALSRAGDRFKLRPGETIVRLFTS
jgi:hypothetical protein